MVCIPFMKQRFWIQIIHKMGHFLLSTDLFLALNGSMLHRNCYRFLIFATDFLIPLYSYKGAFIAILYHNILWYRIVPLNCIVYL